MLLPHLEHLPELDRNGDAHDGQSVMSRSPQTGQVAGAYRMSTKR
jgi:hypothetical protein